MTYDIAELLGRVKAALPNTALRYASFNQEVHGSFGSWGLGMIDRKLDVRLIAPKGQSIGISQVESIEGLYFLSCTQTMNGDHTEIELAFCVRAVKQESTSA